MNLLERLGQLLDPRGPIGEILSPSDVFKSRLGLPVDTPHAARLRVYAPTIAPEKLSHLLAQPRYVPVGSEQPPKDGWRLVSPQILETWTPVYGTAKSDDVLKILLASQELLGWKVEQSARNPYCDCNKLKLSELDKDGVHQVCGRARQSVSDQDFAEHIQQLNINPSDAFYNVFYPTLKGSDGVMTENGLAKGGTQIRGGRAEYNRLTKGMVHWDKGFLARREIEEAKQKKETMDGVRTRAEVYSKKFMPRKLGEL